MYLEFQSSSRTLHGCARRRRKACGYNSLPLAAWFNRYLANKTVCRFSSVRWALPGNRNHNRFRYCTERLVKIWEMDYTANSKGNGWRTQGAWPRIFQMAWFHCLANGVWREVRWRDMENGFSYSLTSRPKTIMGSNRWKISQIALIIKLNLVMVEY